MVTIAVIGKIVSACTSTNKQHFFLVFERMVELDGLSGPTPSQPKLGEKTKESLIELYVHAKVVMDPRAKPKTVLTKVTVKDSSRSTASAVSCAAQRFRLFGNFRAVAVTGLPNGHIVADSDDEDLARISLGGLQRRANGRIDIALLPRSPPLRPKMLLPTANNHVKSTKKTKNKKTTYSLAKQARIAARRLTTKIGLSGAVRARLISLAASHSFEKRTRFHVYLANKHLLREYIVLLRTNWTPRAF